MDSQRSELCREYGCHVQQGYSCEIKNGAVVVKGSLGGVSRIPYLKYETVIVIGSDGRIDFNVKANTREGCCWLPRFGYEFSVSETNSKFTYFGKGPGENYCDLNNYTTYGMCLRMQRASILRILCPRSTETI